MSDNSLSLVRTNNSNILKTSLENSGKSTLSLSRMNTIPLDEADVLKFDRKKNELEIIREDGNQRHIQRYKMYNNTYELKHEVTQKLAHKGDYVSDIKMLYSEGYTQVEIANRLGISQSYVSRLLK